MDKKSLLSCSNITKTMYSGKTLFGKPKNPVPAVSDITIEVGFGETLGLVGKSGSGKTTLGEILGDIQSPDKGIVRYMDENIYKMSKSRYAEYRKNVQFIFQNPKGSMNPSYRIIDVISEPLFTLGITDNKEEASKMVLDALKKVGLESSYAYKFPNMLSGGQCQRAAIARAVIVSPKLIICDEPVSALDVSVQAQVLNLLKDLQKEYGISYIFISHDIGVVNYMADRIAVMKDGKIIETGTAGEVFDSPQNAYTKKLIDSSFVNF